MSRLRELWRKIRFLLSLDIEGLRQDQARALERSAERVTAALREEFEQRVQGVERYIEEIKAGVLREVQRAEGIIKLHLEEEISSSQKSIEKGLAAQLSRLGKVFEDTREEVRGTLDRQVADLRAQVKADLEARSAALYERVQAMLTDQSGKLRAQLDSFFEGQVDSFKRAMEKSGVSVLAQAKKGAHDSFTGHHSYAMPKGLFSST